MVVVVANHIPPAVRGRMKLWFVEPKPNVFVSGIRDNVAKKVIKYLYENCPYDSGLVIFTQSNTAPGYNIQAMGDVNRGIIDINGLQLVKEKDI